MNLMVLLNAVKAIAAEAGAGILEIYETAFAVEKKADASPLTEADLASHRTIMAGLQRLTPDIPILSEESSTLPFAERAQWARFWLVDPLDGTKEFIKRNGEFTVNIALVDGHEPVLGVVYVPVTGLCYFAAKGHGAFCEKPGEAARKIMVWPRVNGPVRVVGSRSHAGPSLQAYVEGLGEHTLISVGSSLKLCMVAEGKADVYPRLGLTSEWDTAAAQCVVEQAGGRVIDVAGKRLAYNTKESLLNPYFLVIGGDPRDWLSSLPDEL